MIVDFRPVRPEFIARVIVAKDSLRGATPMDMGKYVRSLRATLSVFAKG